MSGFLFQCFEIPFNRQYFPFFFVRFVILKVQNIMAVKPPSIFLRRTLISYLHSCR